MARLDHIGIIIPHDKFDEEVNFLLAALAPLGMKEQMRPIPGIIGIGDAPHNAFLWISGIKDGKPVTTSGHGYHVAIGAADVETIKKFHEAALQAGGQCNGKPGERPEYHPGYYAAFVIDPCGNNIEVVMHTCPSTVKVD